MDVAEEQLQVNTDVRLNWLNINALHRVSGIYRTQKEDAEILYRNRLMIFMEKGDQWKLRICWREKVTYDGVIKVADEKRYCDWQWFVN